jgi:hypothetical protein
MKVISFSLWGDDKLYCQGAIDNIACAKEHYPGWICRFYIDKNCPAIPTLLEQDCQLAIMEGEDHSRAVNRNDPNWHMDFNLTGMLWRFFAIDDPNIETVIFRDCDSRVGARDAHAVQEWLDSELAMHRMHECREHWNAQVMGGMWGIHTKYLKDVESSIRKYVNIYRKIRNEPWIFVDLWWIMDVLWPNFERHCMGHGYMHPNNFKVDGPMVGGVVHEEWRGQKYVP